MRTCDGCGVKIPFGISRRKMDGKMVCDGCLNGRPGMPRSQVTRSAVTAAFPPKKDEGPAKPAKATGIPGEPPSFTHPGAPGAAPAQPGAPAAPGMPPQPGMAMAPPAPPPPPPVTPFAPDQQSDLVVRVCPMDGSGNLTGQSDGSIKCGYCDTVFTITIHPSHPFQPMVNPDGSPFQMPRDPQADPQAQIGQASPENTPGAGPVDPTLQTPTGQAPSEPGQPAPGAPAGSNPGSLPAPGAPAGDLDQAFEAVMAEAEGQAPQVPQDQVAPGTVPPVQPQAQQPATAEDGEGKNLPPWMKNKKKKSSMFITASGVALSEDDYVEHLRTTVLHSR